MLFFFFGIVQTKCVVVVPRLFLLSIEFQREIDKEGWVQKGRKGVECYVK